MAITRQTTQTIIDVDLDDDYDVALTVHVGRERLTQHLTPDEAIALSSELYVAGMKARRMALEDGKS